MELLIEPINLKVEKLKAFFTYKNADIRSLIGNKPVFMAKQRHTDIVYVLGENFQRPIADAVITSRRGIFIGVEVADCLPILIYAKRRGVIGAVHAGWRGTAKGIIKKTLSMMFECFNVEPSEILISIGPSIRGCCYEVGQEVIDAIKEETEGDEFILSGSKIRVDLVKANIIQATSLGINAEKIWVSEFCTGCNSHIFASYRRQGKAAGRQYGIIGML